MLSIICFEVVFVGLNCLLGCLWLDTVVLDNFVIVSLGFLLVGSLRYLLDAWRCLVIVT